MKRNAQIISAELPSAPLIPIDIENLINNQQLVQFLDSVSDQYALVRVEDDGNFIVEYVSQGYLDTARNININVSAAEMLGKSVAENSHTYFHASPEMVDYNLQKYQQALESSTPVHYEFSLDAPGGKYYGEASITPITNLSGKITHLLWNTRDITGKKKSEEQEQLTIDLLLLLTEKSDLHEMMFKVTSFLKHWSGCEAVGIRLKDGDDFPYFETRGFPEKFIQLENRLCAYDQNNELVRDSNGDPVLECMCGNVICGRFDPQKSFFTKHGSFWSNCTTDLLATTTEADRQSRTRNRCNGMGYESVALIPLRVGGYSLGLLQLNDHQKNRYTLEFIEMLERLANNIAMALAQRQAEKALTESHKWLSAILDTTHMMVAYLDPRFNFLYVNPAFDKSRGASPAFFVGRNFFDLYPDPELNKVFKWVVESGEPYREDARPFHDPSDPTGGITYLDGSLTPITNPDGTITALVLTLLDVTQRIQAREALREKDQQYQTMLETSMDGFYVLDSQARLLDVNNAYSEMIGYTKDELLQMSVAELEVNESPREVQEHIRQLIQIGTHLYETRHRRKTGELVDFEIRSHYLPHLGGRVYSFLRDITARKKNEDELKEAIKRIQSINEFSQDLSAIRLEYQATVDTIARVIGEKTGDVCLICMLSTDRFWLKPAAIYHSNQEMIAGILEQLNKNPQRPNEGMVGEAFQTGKAILVPDIFHKEYRHLIKQNYFKLLKKLGINSTMFIPLSVKDEVLGILVMSRTRGGAAYTPDDLSFYQTLADRAALTILNANLYQTAQRELVERAKIEEELRESHEQLTTISDNLPAFIAHVDAQEQFLYINQSYAHWLGRSREEIIGKSVRGIIGAKIYAQARGYIKTVLSGQPVTYEISVQGPQVNPQTFSILYVPQFDQNQNVIAYFSLATEITTSKQAEDALRKSEEKYHQLVETLNEGLWVIDKDAVTTYVNPHMAEMLGYSFDEMIGRHLFNFMDEQGVQIARYYLDRRASGIKEQHDFEFIKKDGQRIYTSLETGPLYDDQGNYQGSLAAIADITQRKLAEESLRKLSRAVEQSPATIVITDLSGSIEYVNPKFTNLTGYTREEVLGKNPRFLNSGKTTPEEYKLMWEAITSGKEYRGEFCNRKKNGDLYWETASISPIINSSGEITHFLSINEDITERKHTEVLIQQSEADLKKAQQVARVGNWVWNIQANQLTWSDEMYRIFGIEKENFSGSLSDVIATAIHPDDREKVDQANLSVIHDKTPVPLEYRVIWPDQSIHVVWAEAGELLLDEQGNSSIIMGIVQDITERKKMEKELTTSRQQLRDLASYLQTAREDERTHIAREIHDEFGQRLTALKMDVAWLSRHLRQEVSPVSQKIKEMQENISTTMEIVHQLSSELRPGVLDDFGLVAAIEWQTQEFTKRSEIDCTLKLGNKDIQLDRSVATALFRIFQELITNIGRHAAATQVTVTLNYLPDELILVVKDNGKGITASQMNSPASLGLIGTRERARYIGGDVSIQSTPGEGTTVSVRVPKYLKEMTK